MARVVEYYGEGDGVEEGMEWERGGSGQEEGVVEGK